MMSKALSFLLPKENQISRWLLIVTWLTYWILSLLVDSSGYQVAPITNIYLYGSVLLCFLVSLKNWNYVEARPSWRDPKLNIPRLTLIFSVLIFIGLCLHLYDKVAIQLIDYSKGICSAKLQWFENGSSRQGAISSWQSAAGHILVNLSFVVIFLVSFFAHQLNFRKWAMASVWVLLILLIYSASIGNRSILLFYFGYLICVFLARKKFLGRLSPFSLKKVLVAGLASLVIILGYFVYIFHDRARCETRQDSVTASVSSEKMEDYKNSFVQMFGGKAEEAPVAAAPESKFKSLFNLTILYVTHTQWTFDQVIKMENRVGSNLINSLIGALVKFRIIETPPPRSFSSRLLHLPGSVYFSFGLIGLILFSILAGVLLNLVDTYFGKTIYGTILFVTLNLFIVLSPLTSAANLMAFPYFGLSMVVLFAVFFIGLRYQRRSAN